MPSQHRKHRGYRTQELVADFFRKGGWPHAISTGAGRTGKDILGLPGISCEVKARSDLSPLAWVKQAEAAAKPGDLPVAVTRPNGLGEHPEQFLAFLRLGDLIALLRKAGYGEVAPDGGVEPV